MEELLYQMVNRLIGSRKDIRIVLLAGGDLIQSFAVPNLWKESDVPIVN